MSPSNCSTVNWRALPLVCVCLVVALSGCGSSSKPGSTRDSSSTVMARRLLKPNMGQRSEFEKHMQASTSTKSDTASALQRRIFGTSERHPEKSFSGSKSFAAKESKLLEKRSRAADQQFHDSGESNPYGAKTFATNPSRLGSQESRLRDEAFAGGNETFQTGLVRDATKSQQKNVQPVMIMPTENEVPRTYSEAEIKRMVNRN